VLQTGLQQRVSVFSPEPAIFADASLVAQKVEGFLVVAAEVMACHAG
jgi:hypothetical protein